MNANIKTLFKQSNGYLTRKQIPDKSTYNQLLKLINKGVVVRVKPGIYSYGDIYSGTMIDVEKIEFQQIVTRYLHERLIYRLSVSEYAKNFFLKGGALLYAFSGTEKHPLSKIPNFSRFLFSKTQTEKSDGTPFYAK